MNMSDFRPKRIEVTTPYLTFGIRQDVEEKFCINRGKMIAITTKGDLEMLIIFLSLLIARTSLLDSDHGKIKTVISYPSILTKKDTLIKYIDELLITNGVPSRVTFEHVPVKNSNDMMESVASLNDFDVYIAIYFDFHLANTNAMKNVLSRLEEKKQNSIIMVNRFSRLKKTITESVDGELLVDVSRYLPPEITFSPVVKMLVGRDCGSYKIISSDRRNSLSLKLKYPSFFY